MSGIDFTTRDGSASVRGAERPYGAALAARLTAAVLELDGQHTQESNRRILPDIFFRQAEFNAQMHGRAASLTDTFTYWAPMSGMMYEDGSADIRIGDKTERPDGFVINTAVVAGSDPIALLTRIHAYSEEGCWSRDRTDPGSRESLTPDCRHTSCATNPGGGAPPNCSGRTVAAPRSSLPVKACPFPGCKALRPASTPTAKPTRSVGPPKKPSTPFQVQSGGTAPSAHFGGAPARRELVAHARSGDFS